MQVKPGFDEKNKMLPSWVLTFFGTEKTIYIKEKD